MTTTPQQPQGGDGTISTLNVAIEALNLANEVSGITPAKAVFGSVSILLAIIRVRFPLPYGNGCPFHVTLGLYGKRKGKRKGLRRPWTIVR
jgi:hypothetical protein